jgi:tRNA (adenine57-N1/adenine58-N1)-methyltransferase
VRDAVRSRKGNEYRIYEPTLAEYSSLSPRVVTPVSALYVLGKAWLIEL